MFRLLLFFFLPSAIIILSSLLLFQILPVDFSTIEVYKNICYDMIWDAIIKADYKNIKGTIPIVVSGETLELETVFYENYILNRTIIEEFLNTIDWNKQIKENAFDISALFEQIFFEYDKYIETLNLEYNENIWKNSHVKANAKNDAKQILYDFVISLDNIEAEIIEKVKSMNYLEEILNKITFSHYILTKDFHSKECNLLKAILLTTIEEYKKALQEKKTVNYYNAKILSKSLSWKDLLHMTIHVAVSKILSKGFVVLLLHSKPFLSSALAFMEYFYNHVDPKMFDYFRKILEGIILDHAHISLSEDALRLLTFIIIFHVLGQTIAMSIFWKSMIYAKWLNNVD